MESPNHTLFKDTHLLAKDPAEVNNALNIDLISQNIILYYCQPLNTGECLICGIYQ